MIFVDTGAFLGRYLANDQHHQDAQSLWQKVRQQRMPCVTSNFVLDETFTLLARRGSYRFAAEKARTINVSEAFQIFRPDAKDERAAVELMEKFADQGVSFTDCVSFVLMRKASLEQVFTFDDHFERAGFASWS
jgi:predicted nucleic acid-binding protein